MNKTLTAAMGAGLLALSFGAAAATTTYTFNLSPSQEVPAAASPAAGSFELMLDDVANTISFYTAAFSLAGTVTMAHIHQAPAGSNGGVVFNLYGNASSIGPVMIGPTSIANSFAMLGENVVITPTLLGDINAMPWNYYVNIHTTAFGGGELRGQLAVSPVPEPGTYALLALGLGVVGVAARRRRQAD